MIKKYICNIIEIPLLYLFFRRNYKQQKLFMKETILLDTEGIKQQKDQSLTEKDIRKIKHYYGLAVPIIGEIFCVLRGNRITLSERKTLTYLGGLTGLFDDFFDEKHTPENHIKELINNPTLEICRNSHERLFIVFYLKALAQEDNDRIKESFNIVYNAQILSKKQSDADLSYEDILSITKQKGSVSMLFYRSALQGNFVGSEKELLIHIGLLGQLENDIFDIYKDYQDQIYTLATTTKSIADLCSRYKLIMNEVWMLLEQTDFPKRNKMKFARCIAIIASRGLVCLDQLKKLEDENLFELSKYSRDHL